VSAIGISRRQLLGGAAGALALAACGSSDRGEAGVVRVGVLTNLTHAPLLAAIESGSLARAIAPARLEVRAFRAGPRVVEALLGRAIDIGSTGPAPVVIAQSRHPDALHVVSGMASGGASLVVAARHTITSPADFAGKSLAVTQLGSTQDVSLRKYLRANKLETTTRGGDVAIRVSSAADIRIQMSRGELDGAWLPEPWATRLVDETIATRLLDERDLWPNRQFSSAMIVARSAFTASRPREVTAAVAAIAAQIDRANADPKGSQDDAYGQIQSMIVNAGPRKLFSNAWSRVDFTRDPLRDAVEIFAADAVALGVVDHRVKCGSLFPA
jgi:NitT/TauT family transport system substrate-binding protein